MEPAPMANTTRTRARGEVYPMLSMRGAIMLAVVIMATVDAPMASFRIMAMMKGMSTPRPEETRPPTESAIGRSLRMAPKEPPAPVMARMAAESVTPWVTHLRVFFFSCWGISVMARNTPSSKATTGLPMKLMRVAKKPSPKGLVGKDATEDRAISTMGSRMGEKLWNEPGSLPYFSLSSSRVYSELAGMLILEDTFLA